MPRTRRNHRKLRRAKANISMKKLSRKVDRLFSTLKPELKVSDSSVTGNKLTSPTFEGEPTDYLRMEIPDPALSSGAGYFNQRIGDMIRVRSLQMRAVVRLQGSNVNAVTVRFLLVRFPKGIVPDSLTYVLANIQTQLAVNSPYSTITRNEFQVLYDKTVTLNNFGNDSKAVRFFKKVNLPVHYIADSVNVSSGGLVLYAFSDTNSSSGPLLDLFMRSRYTDN